MKIEQKHLTYLDRLRDSGKINMLGATPYLQRQFSLQETDADEIMGYYMENADEVTILKEELQDEIKN